MAGGVDSGRPDVTYYVNLANGAVTQALFDGAHQPSGWVTKTEGEDSVQICFHLNQVPVLLAAGVPVLLGIKAFGQFSEAYLTSVTGFTAPATPGQYNFYTAGLLNNTVPINLALGSTDGGQTPGDVPMIAQTTCEIEWWLNGPTNPPSKSLTFSVEIDNTPNRGNETAPGNTTPYPAPAAVATAVTQAAAATAYGYANYAAMAAGAVDSAIRGKTASFTSLAGVGTQNFFSTYNPSTHTYARNPACVFSWPSWASVGNSADVDGTGGNRGCVVMISPTQGITAHHYGQIYAEGVTHDFLGSDGATYTLDIDTSVQIGTTDVQLVTFSAPAPAAVGIAPVLAPGVMAQIFGVGTPVVATNQQKQAVVLEMASVPPTNSGNEIYFRAATASNRTAWTANPPAIPGDSSSPIWAYLDGTPFFVSDWHIGTVNPSSGPSIAECASLINAAMAAGTSLSVLPTNTLGLGTAAYAALGTTAGQVPVLNANNQIDPGLLPASAAGGITYVEQTWDGTANVTVNPATTVLRLTTGTPGTQHTITLPASPANAQALEIVVPPSTGTPATDPVTEQPVHFTVAGVNLSIAADPTYTRVFRLIAGTGGWAVDQSVVRQNTDASFANVRTPAAYFTGDLAFEAGTTIHGTEGTAFGFALMAINGAAQFTPVPLGPGESARLNAAGTALEAFAPAQYVPVPANSSAAGVAGQWSSDDSYLYYYGATKWLRVAGSTF